MDTDCGEKVNEKGDIFLIFLFFICLLTSVNSGFFNIDLFEL